MPFANGFDHVLGQAIVKADDQRAAADGMHGLARNRLRLDRYAEIEAELQQQLIEHVLFLAALDKVFGILQQTVFEVGGIGVPGANV